jgi:hypothetical protein
MSVRIPQNDHEFAIYTIRKNELRHGFEYEFDPAPGTDVPRYEQEYIWDYDPRYLEAVRRGQRNALHLYYSSQIKKKNESFKTPWKGNLPLFYQYDCDYTNSRPAFEVKSAVAPLSIHKLIILQHFLPKCTFNRNPSGAGNGGGIHVSTSTNIHTRALKKKVFTFLHTADYGNLMKIGRRSVDQAMWCRQQYPENHPALSDSYWDDEDEFCFGDDDHCGIINTSDGKRYEMRMFAAHPNNLLPAIETSDSLFSLAQEVDEISFENWENFVTGKLRYKELKGHLHATLHHTS